MTRLHTTAVLTALMAAGAASAHHSFAHFDSSRQMLIEGTVTKWSYASPHSWLYVEAPDASGQMKTWSFEGGAPISVTRQGVTGNTYRTGDKVRVVFSPIRDGRTAGGICFVIQADGTATRPNDGACDAPAVFERWKSKGWLDSARHLEVHPLAD